MAYSHQYWMELALEAAHAAGLAGEVPVGAVIVDAADTILAISNNRRERDRDPSAHAEIVAIRQAGKHRQNWQLQHCRLYVTLEPCSMCAAALCQARIQHIIYGADDPKAGALRSVLNLPLLPGHFNQPEVIGGISQERCRLALDTWFQVLRQKRFQHSVEPLENHLSSHERVS